MNFHHLLGALLCTTLWGGSFGIIQWGLQGVPPLLFASLRFAVPATLALMLPRPAVPLHRLLAYSVSWGVIQFGGLFLAIHSGVPSGISSVLAQTQVFFTFALVALLGWEKLRRYHYASFALAAGGLSCLCIDQRASVPITAMVYAFGGAMGWAIGNVIVRSMHVRGHPTDSLSFLAWSSLLPSIVLGAASLWAEEHTQLQTLFHADAWRSAIAILYQSVLALVVGTLIWNRLLQHYPASRVAPFSLISPIVGLIIGSVFLEEKRTPFQLGGAFLLFLGLLVHVLWASKHSVCVQQVTIEK